MCFSLSSSRVPKCPSANRSKSIRLIVLNDTDKITTGLKELLWLRQQYPGHQVTRQAMVKQNSRMYDRFTFKTADGNEMLVLFYVTRSVQHNCSSGMTSVPNGTVSSLSSTQMGTRGGYPIPISLQCSQSVFFYK
jgi:hypothetical protein